MKNHKLGILKVRDNFQSCGEIESMHEFGGKKSEKNICVGTMVLYVLRTISLT